MRFEIYVGSRNSNGVIFGRGDSIAIRMVPNRDLAYLSILHFSVPANEAQFLCRHLVLQRCLVLVRGISVCVCSLKYLEKPGWKIAQTQPEFRKAT